MVNVGKYSVRPMDPKGLTTLIITATDRVFAILDLDVKITVKSPFGTTVACFVQPSSTNLSKDPHVCCIPGLYP